MALTLRPDEAIDLQLHTIYSDGLWQPEELLGYLAGAGFRAVAITDHDHLDHTAELAALGQRHGVFVIPAVEMSTEWEGRLADLLCFAPAFTGDALAVIAKRTERLQLENTWAVNQELERRGYIFPNRGAVLARQAGAVVRPVDNATLLVSHGYAPTLAEGLMMITDAGYVSIHADLGETVAAAHAAGAVALLAHPGRGEAPFTRYDPDLLDDLRANIPLDGIEVRYPLHSAAQVAVYGEYAERHGWLQSAGSDSHGPDQRLPIAYPAAVARDLLERCGIHVAA
ncbi:MAG TPA: PHP domain-containing protein [Ktedonobacterales bacterium]|nr:PHP domain-containing protein [Ktedonobacterales bacterium]